MYCVVNSSQRPQASVLSGQALQSIVIRLHEAVREGGVKEVRQLLTQSPAAVRGTDATGNTALHVAAQANPTQSSAPHQADPRDSEACANAAQRYVAITALLLDHGADAGARNEAGETALHFAARLGGNLDIAILLLDHRANLHAADAEGNTPLHCAYAIGEPRRHFITLFVNRGGAALLSLTNQAGCTARQQWNTNDPQNGIDPLDCTPPSPAHTPTLPMGESARPDALAIIDSWRDQAEPAPKALTNMWALMRLALEGWPEIP